MEFPQGSHFKNQQPIVDNAKAIEDELKKVDWRYLVKVYFAGLSILLVTIFSLIVVVKAALSLF